ncbi:RNA polymerase sigma factor [Portibacter marinus]|uniref:RNA polymerase sigma factor n=1 Tax=Portibacter marinus TaxID=2898660 RepID=UPI001F1E8AA7|nr:sigma-70 family RNA polymerase sigma factor [Portibacter marinus]
MRDSTKNIDLQEDLSAISKYRKSQNQRDLLLFFNKYKGLVFGVCMKYLKDVEASKDAIMDIYEKLVDKLLKHEVSYPKSWLYTLTKNHCYEILRNNRRVMEKENEAALMYSEEVFHPNYENGKEEELNMLENCVEKLEKEQQMAVRLFYLEKKTYQEVTEMMKITWSKTRSLIQNGRRNLKNCMEKKYASVREK